MGIYLHSLGDNWSHQACIEAVDGEGLPFASHVIPVQGRRDPLWPCRWTSHQDEFGDPEEYPESDRTFAGALAVYQALVEFARQRDRPIYRPIPVTAEDNHIHDTVYEFVHAANANHPNVRRAIADDLKQWALETRANNPKYWPRQVYLPLIRR
ncbi:MAG: hypothetical protein MAG451_00900 [Anaerolineales bacterium]|nr:hypothetical protein [Anaerolineales bacterium]